ncbi:hypothetical protein PROFUN_09112 [Planoprotostelium fungivorum]|uniref:Sulfate transporter family protein n=1 Tax=Planoprotostelium fungivorum TaxID=1890364 RepID=A0A2P6NHX8_9EUKA|nr:hypothetical protein PROFUN_09112 [Planoprotostelium fungivorum]
MRRLRGSSQKDKETQLLGRTTVSTQTQPNAEPQAGARKTLRDVPLLPCEPIGWLEVSKTGFSAVVKGRRQPQDQAERGRRGQDNMASNNPHMEANHFDRNNPLTQSTDLSSVFRKALNAAHSNSPRSPLPERSQPKGEEETIKPQTIPEPAEKLQPRTSDDLNTKFRKALSAAHRTDVLTSPSFSNVSSPFEPRRNQSESVIALRAVEVEAELEDLESQNDKDDAMEPATIQKDDSHSSTSETPEASFVSRVGVNIMFGFIVFLIVMPNAFGFGGILTQNPKMKSFFPVVIQLSLMSNIVHQLVAVLQSRLVFNISMVQETNILFPALMVNIVAESTEENRVIPTMFFVFAVTSILMGIGYYAIGRLNLVSIIQYIPYPVMAGFLVAVGVYLVEASVAIMTDYPFENFEEMKHTFQSGLWLLAVPGVIVGLVIILMDSVSHHYLVMPLCLVVPFSLFWVVVGMKGISIETLRAQRFLFEPMESVPVTQIWNYWNWELIDYSVLPSLLPNFISMVILNVLNTTLNVSGLEYVLSRSINSSKELEGAGIGNIIVGCFGGFGGSITFSNTGFVAKYGANRLTGIVTCLLGLVLLLANVPIIEYIPRFFFGAVLFYIGAEMVWAWLYKPYASIPLFEFFLLVATASSLMILGNNVGLPVSLAIAALFFAFQYAQIKPVRKALHGIQVSSKVQRPYIQRKILSKHTENIWLLQLQGYLFFGSTVQLLAFLQDKMGEETETRKKINRMKDENTQNPLTRLSLFIKRIFSKVTQRKYNSLDSSEPLDEADRMESGSVEPEKKKRKSLHSITQRISSFIEGKKESKKDKKLSYLILDFAAVPGMDSTAMSSFMKIVQMAASDNITLVFCGLSARVEKVFRKHRVISENPRCRMKIFDELDLAVEWCEDKIIRSRVKGGVRDELANQTLYDYVPDFISTLAAHLPPDVTDEQCVELVNRYFNRKRLVDGEVLYTFGDFGTSIYYLKQGQLNHYGISDENGAKLRHFKTTKGTFVGELSKFLGIPHDLSCEAEGPCTVYELTNESFSRMEMDDPVLAFAVYSAVIQSLCLTFQTARTVGFPSGFPPVSGLLDRQRSRVASDLRTFVKHIIQTMGSLQKMEDRRRAQAELPHWDLATDVIEARREEEKIRAEGNKSPVEEDNNMMVEDAQPASITVRNRRLSDAINTMSELPPLSSMLMGDSPASPSLPKSPRTLPTQEGMSWSPYHAPPSPLPLMDQMDGERYNPTSEPPSWYKMVQTEPTLPSAFALPKPPTVCSADQMKEMNDTLRHQLRRDNRTEGQKKEMLSQQKANCLCSC